VGDRSSAVQTRNEKRETRNIDRYDTSVHTSTRRNFMRAFTFAAIDLPAASTQRALLRRHLLLISPRSCSFVETRAVPEKTRCAPRRIESSVVTLCFWYARRHTACGNYNARYSIFSVMIKAFKRLSLEPAAFIVRHYVASAHFTQR